MKTIRLGFAMTLMMSLFSVASAWADKKAPSATDEIKDYGFHPPNIGAAFEDERAEVRQLAAKVAGENHLVEYVPELRAALGDNNSWVRVVAAGTLLGMEDRSGVEVLTLALESPDTDLIVEAADHLVRLRETNALARLLEVIQTPQAAGRLRAIRVAGKYLQAGLEGVIPPLAEIALDESADVNVRRVCVDVLQSLHDEATVQSMMEKLTHDPDTVIRGLAENFVQRQR